MCFDALKILVLRRVTSIVLWEPGQCSDGATISEFDEVRSGLSAAYAGHTKAFIFFSGGKDGPIFLLFFTACTRAALLFTKVLLAGTSPVGIGIALSAAHGGPHQEIDPFPWWKRPTACNGPRCSYSSSPLPHVSYPKELMAGKSRAGIGLALSVASSGLQSSFTGFKGASANGLERARMFRVILTLSQILRPKDHLQRDHPPLLASLTHYPPTTYLRVWYQSGGERQNSRDNHLMHTITKTGVLAGVYCKRLLLLVLLQSLILPRTSLYRPKYKHR